MFIRFLFASFLMALTLTSCSGLFRGMKDLDRYEGEGWYIHPADLSRGKRSNSKEITIRERTDTLISILESEDAK